MADNTKIEWADHTFNPWVGCTKVSPACDHCYAESWAKRSGMVEWGNHPRSLTSDSNWAQPLKWNKAAKAAGVRRRVFCASLADVFDNQVPEAWRWRLWGLIDACRDLDWLLLTKRPQNIAKMLPDGIRPWSDGAWPNVWLGTTVENQEEANRRIPELTRVPAAKHFLSCEPLLGPVDLRNLVIPRAYGTGLLDAFTLDFKDHHQQVLAGPPKGHGPVDWVIVGGESGPGARPMHPDWARSLRAQCQFAGVAFFFKQWGEWVNPEEPHGYVKPHSLGPDRVRYACEGGAIYPIGEGAAPSKTLLHKVGKKVAGRLLDGREHSEFPA